jgi:hypothetical protein
LVTWYASHTKFLTGSFFHQLNATFRSNGEPLVQQRLPLGQAIYILTLSLPVWTAVFFNPQ